ncbi:MAG: hypothetical protein C4555_04510 [Dehalococcoidia bacterium]|nr:MAG: hypothetical protein C4555_04510 [Dehalococcoidia bacterium]
MKTTTTINKIFTVITSLVLSAALGCGGEVFKNLLGGGIARIEVSPGSCSIAKGTNQQLTATVIFTDGTRTEITSESTWSASDTSLAEITSTGEILSKQTGTVTITASYKGKTATAAVTITSATLVSLQITPLTRTMPNGTQYQFIATGVFTDSTTQNMTTQVNWGSNDTGLVNITLNGGLATANASATGSTTISATHVATGTATTASVTITSAALTAISVSPLEQSIAKGTKLQYSAKAYYSNNTIIDITELATWSSSTGAATISSNGLATGANIGTTTIQALYSTKSASTTLEVTSATLLSIDVTPNNPIAYGTTQQFTALGSFSDSSTQDITNQVVWSSSDAGIATISNASGTEGLASSVASGTTTITATYDPSGLNISGNTSLEVRLITLQSITIVPASVSKDIGQTQQYYANGKYSDGTVQDLTNQVLWSTSSSSFAEISNASGSQGFATAIGTGTATISATRDRVTGTATMTINAPDSINPTMSQVELLPGNKVKIVYNEDMSVAGASNPNFYKIVTTVGGSCATDNNFSGSTQTTDFNISSVDVQSLTTFILNLDAGTNAVKYTVIGDKANIKDLAGNTLGCPNYLEFQGKDTVAPYVVSAINDTSTSIIVRFSEAMKEGGGASAADNLANYTIIENPANGTYDDPVKSGISKIDEQTFKITFTATLYGIPYKVTVADAVTDLSSNAITDPKYVTFQGNEQLKMVSAEALTLKTVKVTFSKSLLTTSAECSSASDCAKLYKISPSLGEITQAVVGSGQNANTVTLTHQLDQEGIAYSVIAANRIDGDQFNNVADNKSIRNLADNEDLQKMPKDRATFLGLGTTIANISDGAYFTDPFSDTTSFNFAFVFGNKIYLGPNTTNVSAFRFDANGYNSVLVTFAATSQTCATATGLGYGLGTTCNATDPTLTNQGFNGERGLVGFNSATVTITGNPYEILLVGPLKDGVTKGYFTQDLDNVLDWTPVDFNGTGGNNTKSIQTVYGIDNYVYFAASSDHNTQAPVVAVSTLTRTGDVVSVPATVDMAMRSITNIGKNAGNSAEVVGIDSIRKFNGNLYMSNNGGIRYSSNFTTFSGDVDSTPSSIAGTTLWLPDAPAGLEKLSPGQKGIPLLLEYNGKLYMGRNVATGSTAPSSQTAQKREAIAAIYQKLRLWLGRFCRKARCPQARPVRFSEVGLDSGQPTSRLAGFSGQPRAPMAWIRASLADPGGHDPDG